jgi:Domain of unknown function (DUF4382)/Carboxypeptidase regulatory-like domain
MKTNVKALLVFCTMTTLMLSLASCSKEDNPTDGNLFRLDPNENPKTFSVFLTDDAGSYQQVVLDIQKVEIKEDLDNSHYDDDFFADADDNADDHLATSDSFGVWKPLNFDAKPIDVLALSNGLETKLGDATTYNRVRKVRLTLGNNSYLVDQNGDKQPLVLENDSAKYMYANLHKNDIDYISSNVLDIVRVDFNVFNSIKEDNGTYIISPKLRAFSLTNFGEIDGLVYPYNIKSKVTIEDAQGNIYQAIPEANGSFKVRGLPANDNYTIIFEAVGYQTQILNNVVVDAGKATFLETITLQQ